MPVIALIHALRHSPPPIEDAFARLWPQARLVQRLDESLSADLEREGRLTSDMTARFLAHAQAVVDQGAQAILFTCSAFGPCIDACREAHRALPVLKPNEAMIEEAVAHGGRIGLLASFAPTLQSMPAEFPPGTSLKTAWAEGALAALDRGDAESHDRLAAATAAAQLADCDVIALAQFSLARAAQAVDHATGKPVLTTPDCAVRLVRRRLAA